MTGYRLDFKHQAELLVLRFDPPSGGWGEGLRPAERAVAEGIIAGKTNAAIAAERGVSKRTVANQVARIFEITGTNSRAELVRQALTAAR